MDNDQQDKLNLIITGIKEQGDGCPISEWERDFMISIEERLLEWGERMRVSDKQWAVIDRIYDKVIGC